MKRVALFLVLLLSAATALAEDRWVPWPALEGASATGGPKKQGVYHDPTNKERIVIYPACWHVDRKTEMVLLLNCSFKLKDGQLVWDRNWGTPTGVEWGDSKLERLSFWSVLFRKPTFESTAVSIWDGAYWIRVTGLPARAK